MHILKLNSFLFYKVLLKMCMSDIQDYNHSLSLLPKNWVIFRLSSLGDIVLTTGVIQYWHNQFQWNITVITSENAAPIFKNNPNVQETITLKKEQLTAKNLFLCLYGITQKFTNYGFIDLHKNNKTWLLKLLWKGPVYTYPKMDFERRIFLISKGKFFKKALNNYSVTQRYAKAVEKNPPNKLCLKPNITLLEEELASARTSLKHLLTIDKKIVAIHPYSLHKNKAWHNKGWIAVITQLTQKGIPWFIIGQGSPIINAIPTRNDFTNKTSLRETCALLYYSSVLITGDSGPMHLATAVGTPVIALFGPTTKEWGFFPMGKEHTILESKNLLCRPCSLHGSKPCSINHLCMKDITSEQVMQAVENTLQKAKDLSLTE